MISLVISVYNEEHNLEPLFDKIREKIPYDKEIIFVNDGSIDNSINVLKSIKQKHKSEKIKIINFSRNFGHEAAMYAGMTYAEGEYVVCMDADLQHPPEVAKKMIDKAEKQALDIVLAKRIFRKDGGMSKNLFSTLFYKLINKISPFKFEEGVSDFFLLRKNVKDILITRFTERNIFIRGIIQNLGFEKDYLEYVAEERFKGESSYSPKKLIKLSIEAIISYSKMPLYFSLFLGILFGFISLGVGIYSIIMKFLEQTPPGYTTLVVLSSFMFSILFFVLGIMGLYIGYMFEEQKKRPLYIIKEVL